MYSFFDLIAFIFFVLIDLPILGAWVGYMIVMIIEAALVRGWREVVSRLIILLCIWPCFIYLCIFSGDCVHLAIMYPSYLSKISGDQRSDTRFDWGNVGFIGTSIQKTLVFDPSDGIIKEDMTRPPESTAPTEVRHLIGHFYLVLYSI